MRKEYAVGRFFAYSRKQGKTRLNRIELKRYCNRIPDYLKENDRRSPFHLSFQYGRKHLSKIPIYETDDYVQEGTILLWTLIQKKKYNGKGKLSSLFYTAFDRKCINLHRSYVLKNLVQIHETDDDLYYYGYHICRLVIDEYATEYRKKQTEWNKRWAE